MQHCFACRLMRSAGLVSVGALLGGYGALWLGLPRSEAIWYAMGGGLVLYFVITKLTSRRTGPAEGKS